MVPLNLKLSPVEFKAAKDKADGVEGVVEIPKEGSKEDIIKAVVDNVKWQMDEDRKTTALKQLQDTSGERDTRLAKSRQSKAITYTLIYQKCYLILIK